MNTLKANAAQLIDQWRTEQVDFKFLTYDWADENLAFELIAHPPLNSLASLRDGLFYVQDPSTLLAPMMLDPQPGEAILDACAAPGGKTTYIAQLIFNQGRIIARDLSPDRLKLVRENGTRLGASCIEVANAAANVANATATAAATCDLQPLTFNRILVDAPCSNTGVLRRRVDLRWRIQPLELDRLRATQLELLNQCTPQVKPGGVMVYSTCSLEPEENTGVIQQFLAAHPDWKLTAERQLLPWVDNVDGAYVARLVRQP